MWKQSVAFEADYARVLNNVGVALKQLGRGEEALAAAQDERVWLFKDMRSDYAAEKLDETRQRISDFARSARQHNFIFQT